MNVLFPNVPLLPGVPNVGRSVLFPTSPPPTIQTQATAGALFHATQAAPVWGVFDLNGNRVIAADSVLDFGYRREYAISDFPVQQSQFATYNKVVLPFDVSVMLVKGTSEASRAQFLTDIESVLSSIELYNIMTPERTYLNCTGFRVEIQRRSAAGANYIEAEMFFRQVISVTPQYTDSSPVATSTENASVASALPNINQGLTQGQTPSLAATQEGFAALYGLP